MQDITKEVIHDDQSVVMTSKVGQVGGFCSNFFLSNATTRGRHFDWRWWFVYKDVGIQKSETLTKVISLVHHI